MLFTPPSSRSDRLFVEANWSTPRLRLQGCCGKYRPKQSLSESWDRLTLQQQSEAVEFSRASDTMVMEVPAVIGYDLDEILAS
jgi:hypothetical protein